MAINITQFAPPSRVSSLVWDKNMEPPAGKVFEGDLVGDVTGDLTGDMVGNITNGGVNGYLLRSGVVSASSGTLIVPAGSSAGNTPVTIKLNGNGTYCIVGNTQKCIYPNPLFIPVTRGYIDEGWNSYDNNSYAKSYDADGVLIDSIGPESGNLNIYGASYIILNGGTSTSHENGSHNGVSMSVADTYIDADTTITPGMMPHPTNGVFTGDVVGNVTGNVRGNVTGNLSGKIIVNGCSWSNATVATGIELQDAGYVSLIAKASVISKTTTPVANHRFINYPYLGCIDFRPKPASPALTFTVTLSGPSQSESIGGQLDVFGADNTTVLRTYRKDNAIGTFTFPVDLTGARRLVITSQGDSSTTVTSSIDSLYVRVPYGVGLVD